MSCTHHLPVCLPACLSACLPPALLHRQFTDAALGLSLTILNSLIDLVSFSGILYSIYPPLFAALLAYSIGGTVGSVWLGKVWCGLSVLCVSSLAGHETLCTRPACRLGHLVSVSTTLLPCS